MTFVARVGRDMFGDQSPGRIPSKTAFAVDHVFRDKASPSGVALIFVARDGENSIAVASGANAASSLADVQKARQAISCRQRAGNAA